MNIYKKSMLRNYCVTAIMGAIGTILMYLEFSVPFMPGFIKVDFSELPALITSFSLGPWYGVLVCLLKNLLHLFGTTTVGVGEASNFILGAIFVGTAGWIYRLKKTRAVAFLSCMAGALAMALVGVLTNYYIVYPFYSQMMGMPISNIVGMYKAIMSSVDNLWECLLVFNLPFNFLKGMVNAIICFGIYKNISPILKGKIR